MIPYEVELLANGGHRCRADKGHSLTAMWLEYDLGGSGDGAIEEFFEELRELYDGRRKVAMTGGDAVAVVADRTSTTLSFFKLSERETTDELIDAILRWFDVANPELADQLRALGGFDPDRGRTACLLAQPLAWDTGADAEHPYETHVAGQRWQIRINDFPAEVLYSLLVEGYEIMRFNDWPSAWRRP